MVVMFVLISNNMDYIAPQKSISFQQFQGISEIYCNFIADTHCYLLKFINVWWSSIASVNKTHSWSIHTVPKVYKSWLYRFSKLVDGSCFVNKNSQFINKQYLECFKFWLLIIMLYTQEKFLKEKQFCISCFWRRICTLFL